MTRQNRVLPNGEIVADPARGLFMGNRGCLHDAEGRLGRARWRHKAWIICVLSFKGRKRPLMAPGRYTELFFLDEAVALAAGHRPCAECRRAAFDAFRTAWQAAGLAGGRAPEIDAALHATRLAGQRPQADPADLPDGAMVMTREGASLCFAGALRPFTPAGYGPPRPRPPGPVPVLTPAPSLAALRAGYRPVLHPTV